MSHIIDVGISIILRLVNWATPQPKFGRFLRLEYIKDKIVKAAKRKEKEFPELLISYVSAAFPIPKFILSRLRWDILLLLFSIYSQKAVPKVIIPLLTSKDTTEGKKDSWDYDGRAYSMYVHMIAKTYGWNEKYINKMNIDNALALVQEILTDQQLDREFLWSMSEKSYIYNYQTKSGKANPLPRPDFMGNVLEEVKKIQIPKSMMPAGATFDAVPLELRPK